MAWLSIKIRAYDDAAEQLSDALMELGALSASIEDANAETPDEQPIFGEPGDPPPGVWQQSIVSALFEDGADVMAVMTQLAETTGLQDLHYEVEQVAEQDWVRATQSQFDPIRIREDLWIVPSWHEAPNPNALNIVLDPGLAFGTGSHPTTHLCLAWLAEHVEPGISVLDYGCGSGILAIAAKKLGAGRVIGTDIDEQAITSSRYNAEQNQVEADFYLPDQLERDQLRNEPADLVVANILSRALTVLAPALAAACKPDGSIALSGILREQEEQVTEIYSEWFDMLPPAYMESWVLLTGTRKCA
jgi:ribosomal protein L11 methyltransferase